MIHRAKLVEVQDWIAKEVVRKLPGSWRPSPHEGMKMRRALTWKEDGAKAKARLVTFGFQDARF